GGHPPVPAPQDPALPAVRLLPPQRPMARRPPGTDGDDPPGRHPVSHLRDRLPVRPRGPVTPPARPGLCHGRPRRFTTGDGHHPPDNHQQRGNLVHPNPRPTPDRPPPPRLARQPHRNTPPPHHHTRQTQPLSRAHPLPRHQFP